MNSRVTSETAQPGAMHYWHILRRYRGTMLLTSLLGVAAGLATSFLQTPVYRARTSVEIQSLNENFLNMADVNTVATAPAYRDLDLQTQLQLLQSESLIERVVTKLKLERPFTAPPPPSGVSGQALALPTPGATQSREQIVKAALKNIKVHVSPQSRIVEIFFDSNNPRLSADFLNTLTSESMEQSLEARWNSNQHTGEWLTRQMEDLKARLEKSEDELQAYARASGLLFTSEKENVVEEKLKQLQQELSKAQADRVAKQSRHEIAVSSPPDALPDVVLDDSLREYHVKLADLRRQLAELSDSLTPAHPKVKRVQAQIVSLEAELKQGFASLLTRIRNEYQSAERREKLLTADYATQARLVSDQAGKTIHYGILKREVDANRQLYEAMLQKVKEAGIAAAMRASNLRVVDRATPPSLPYKPDFSFNTSLGLLSGAFAGIAFVMMRERSDSSMHAPGDASVCLNLPELGVIPATRGTELASWLHKPSLLGESFRSVLTSILLSGQNGDRPRIIVLSSPNPSEGKSTIVSNLGIALAEIDQKVLLIDADMRKPRLHQIFDVPNSWGLSDLLRERNPIVDCPPEALARETEIRGLYLLPSGPGTVSISNLLYSTRLVELLDRLRNEFDTVLIDTPAMLLLPDARVLAQAADAVVLVVRAGFTTRASASAARQRFTEDGARVLGAILNHWNPASNDAHAYGYRAYHQHYKCYYKDNAS
jgi:capsular exopolysaccharide synthesis family protein